MPTSVLLAVLAAAGLLALAPALVRRYDATERLVAERALSTARVLNRQRRQSTLPRRRNFCPPQPGEDSFTESDESGPVTRTKPKPVVRRVVDAEAARLWRYRRRRRVLSALLLFNFVELAGVVILGPGLWIGVAVSMLLLAAYTLRLRTEVVAERRRHRQAMARAREAARRRAERIAVERAELRAAAEQAAAAARRGAAAHRSQRRRQAQLPTRRPVVRGAAYEARAVNF